MSQIERTLEDERRIINAAEENWGNSAIGTDDRIEFIAHARTALPLRNAQLEAVLALHQELRFWAVEGIDHRSYENYEDALDMADGDAYNVHPFTLCKECMKVEEGPCEGDCTAEMGYLTSQWPCPTIRAIEEAGA